MSGVHLVAGPNNAGKSNILSAVDRLLPRLSDHASIELASVDLPSGSPVTGTSEARPTLAIAIPTFEDLFSSKIERSRDPYGVLSRLMSQLLECEAIDGRGNFWIELIPNLERPLALGPWSAAQAQGARLADQIAPGIRDTTLERFCSNAASLLVGRAEGDPGTNLAAIIDSVFRELELPTVAVIPPFRQIAEGDGLSGTSYAGDGLAERLGRLQNPEASNYDADKARFHAVNAFVQDLLSDPRARLEVTRQNDLLLEHNGQRLPLSSYGTGIHQTIILAVASSVLENHLVCIEEPEIHLHPTMQRKLLGYLAATTSNQYLVATHSAAMLDAARASISAVSLQGGYSRVQAAITPEHVARIGAELGYRASDLVQSNAVIWVEGPSDRTYLSFWLSQLAPDLEEGKHFSIMFYGGSLLRYLAPEDPSVEEFVTLPRLNRNYAVVMDSDKLGPYKRISATKRHIKTQLDDGLDNHAVWVTKGYTIENYVPPDLLADAVRLVHPSAACTWSGETYENPLGQEHLANLKYADKPAVALTVTELWRTAGPVPADWSLDLRSRVGELVALVRAAND